MSHHPLRSCLKPELTQNKNPNKDSFDFFIFFPWGSELAMCETGFYVYKVRVKKPFNILRPRQNGRYFADDTFNRIFVNENVRISIEFSLKFVPKGPINNIPALVQIMAWRRPGEKPLSEPVMVSLLTHICVTRPQWVNIFSRGKVRLHLMRKSNINPMILIVIGTLHWNGVVNHLIKFLSVAAQQVIMAPRQKTPQLIDTRHQN